MSSFLNLEEFKAMIRVEGTEEDFLLRRLLTTAEAYVGDPDNGILGRPVVATEFVEYFDSIAGVSLKHPDEVSAISVAYTDASGAAQTLAPADYELREGVLVNQTDEAWPEAKDVTVTYTAGWASTPEPVRDAAYFYAGALEDARHGQAMMPDKLRMTMATMLRGYRRVGV